MGFFLRTILLSFVAGLLLTFALSAQLKQVVAPTSPILGFSPAHATAEHQLETAFQSIPSPEKTRDWHHAFTASLREDAYDADPDTKNSAVSSSYFGYSASGDVTAEVVYAHSGNPEDYDLLRKNGISVKGKIVLVRYSNPYSYRGFKALTAEREGAAALLIYSDPAEDGFTSGKVFPDGPWGPESHIQRGAITYDYIVPGDPTTPGWASVEGAKRIPIEQAVSVPKIMAVAMSWRDARHLLERLDGPAAPRSWQG